MSFWETIRGTHLAEVLTRELPRLNDSLQARPVFVACEDRDDKKNLFVSSNTIQSMYVETFITAYGEILYALKLISSGKEYVVKRGTEEECLKRQEELIKYMDII